MRVSHGYLKIRSFILCLLCMFPVLSAANSAIYGITSGSDEIFEITPVQGSSLKVDDLPFGSSAMARDHSTGFVYFYESGASAARLAYWDPTADTYTLVRTYTIASTVDAARMDFSPDGTLYLSDSEEKFYTIDKANGNVTLLGTVSGLETGPYDATGDMAFAPDGTLWVVNYRSLYTIDLAALSANQVSTGMINTLGPGDVGVWTGLAYCDGQLYASSAERRAGQSLIESSIFSIDPATGQDQFIFNTQSFLNDLSSCPTSTNNNTDPVAFDQTVVTGEDEAVQITLTGTDADGDALGYSIVSTPTVGSLTGSGINYTYVPAVGFTGFDSFEFLVNDGVADSDPAVVSITVEDTPNNPPVAFPQSVTVNQNSVANIILVSTDPEDDPLTYQISTPPTNGILSGSNQNYSYTPNPGFSGSDSFEFRTNDGQLDSNFATVSITVDSEPNNPPVAFDQSVTVDQDSSISIVLTATDSDGDQLSYTIVSEPSNGLVSGTGDTYLYTPDSNFTGSDSIEFRVSDGQVNSNIATVSVEVEPVDPPNSAPVAIGQSISTDQNVAVAVTLLGSDVDGDALTYTIVTQPTNGSLAGSGDSYTYTPSIGFIGSDSFEFAANDGQLDSEFPATISISVNSTSTSDIGIFGTSAFVSDEVFSLNLTQGSIQKNDDLPFGTSAIAQDSQTGFVYFYESGILADRMAYWDPSTGNFVVVRNYAPANFFEATQMDFAPDGTLYLGDSENNLYTIDKVNGDVLLIGQVSGLQTGPYDAIGDMAFAPDGTLWVANYRSLYTVDLASLSATPIYTGMISNLGPGEEGIWTGLAYCEGDLYASSAERQTGQPISSVESSLYKIDPATGQEVYLFNSQTFLNDLSSCSTSGANTTPVAFNQNVNTAVGDSVQLLLTATDADGDPLSFSLVSSPDEGTLTGSGSSYIYTPAPGFSGNDSFLFRVNDGLANSGAATVNISVGTLIYGANAYNYNEMTELNLTSNSSSVVGDLPFGSQAIATDPLTGYVYFYEWENDANQFAYWDPTTGETSIIRTYNPISGFYAKRMDFAPDGTLYISDDQEYLYTIDKTNGDIGFLGLVSGLETGGFEATGDMAFAPDGTLWVVNYRSMYLVDLTTRAASLVYTDMISTVDLSETAVWTGLGYCDGFLYASSAENIIPGVSSTSALFRIDPATGEEEFLFYSNTFVNDLTSC